MPSKPCAHSPPHPDHEHPVCSPSLLFRADSLPRGRAHTQFTHSRAKHAQNHGHGRPGWLWAGSPPPGSFGRGVWGISETWRRPTRNFQSCLGSKVSFIQLRAPECLPWARHGKDRGERNTVTVPQKPFCSWWPQTHQQVAGALPLGPDNSRGLV